MLKIMLADVDYDNVTNFRAYIKQKFSIFELVKPALTISELRKGIEDEMPDIIIMEIRFFGNNSVQAIMDLNSKYPKIKFILYGSINESEYMKKLLDYGVIAYMYRPVKPKELNRCLDEALREFEKEKAIDEEHKALMKIYEGQLSMFENRFLCTLVTGRLTQDDEILESFDYFEIKIEPPYTTAVLRIDHFRKVVLTLDEKEKHLLILKINNIIQKNLSDHTAGTSFINHFNEIVMLMGGFKELDEIMVFLNEIKNQIKLNVPDGINVSIGVGRSYDRLTKFQTSFNEANAALRYRCINGYSSIIPIEYVEAENKITYNYPIEREELLVYTAIIGEYNYCVKLLDELLNALKEADQIPKNLISQIVMDILISINRNAVEQGLNLNGINQFFSTSEILKIQTIEQARELMIKGLKGLCEFIAEYRKNSEKEIFDKAIEYIDKNYFENITYFKMSQELACSVEFFKRIFNERAEKSLSDYVARKRIDVAKQLILETNMNDEAIAVNVGYADLNVFRNVFRSLEGYMVGDFRYIKNRNVKQ